MALSQGETTTCDVILTRHMKPIDSQRLPACSVLLVLLAQPFSAARTLCQQPASAAVEVAQSQCIRGRDLSIRNEDERGLMVLRQAASNGLGDAQFLLAKTLLSPKAKESRSEGLGWCLSAGQQGSPDARRLLVDTLQAADPGSYFTNARPWLLSLAENGESHFQYKAALWLFYGKGGYRDHQGAFVWSQKAALVESGSEVDPGANYFLGYLLENGFGTTQDYTAAARAYWAAASRGQVDAAFRLGLLLEHGQGVTKDAEAAGELYRKAASLGLDRAQFQLARGLINGLAGATNLTEAHDWMLKSARQGFRSAQAELGLIYEQGRLGKDRDPAEALAWYRTAARGGHRGARILASGLEERVSPGIKEEAARRFERLCRSNRLEETEGTRQVGTNLLPGKLTANQPIIAPDRTKSRTRPRTVLEARLRQKAAPSAESVRDDLHAGKLQVYCKSLQSAVDEAALTTLRAYAEKLGGPPLNWPRRLELILSFRLLSDGRVDDVQVLEANGNDMIVAAFVSALLRVCPLPCWTPSILAEMSEDHQDLLMAFGPKSQMKVQCYPPPER